MGYCSYKRFRLAGFGHTQKDVYEGSHLKGGEVPPTNPVGLDPTKPGETTASAQQLLPGCYSGTGRIAGIGAVTAGCERYPASKLALISFNREVARSLPPQSNLKPQIKRY